MSDSDNKAIKKDDRNTLKEIERICGRTLRRISMRNPSIEENLFNIDKEGSIIMLGFDFVELNLDENQMGLLRDQIRKLENLNNFIVWRAKETIFLEWLKELKKIDRLVLSNCHFTTIPEWVKECTILKELELANNEIRILPNWILSLNELYRFDIRANPIEINQENLDTLQGLFEKIKYLYIPTALELFVNFKIPVEHLELVHEIEEQKKNLLGTHIAPLINSLRSKVKEGQLIEWYIPGEYYKIESLPENFGILKNLQKLAITRLNMVSLPESFGELTELKELDLSNNKLTSLPDSFVNLTSITKLDLNNNQFTEIPTELWALKELTELNVSNNPFIPEEMTISQKVPDLIRKHLRAKATIRVFVSHAVMDYGPYRVGELVEYLEKQKEISEVFFCEEDLAGNIDEWMLNAVQKCQLILFIGTNKSVFHSVDCANELQLADKFSIPVIPLKGKDVDWPDLAEKNLSRELGLEYDTENFDEFCSDVYKYIENFKREINLMEKEDRRLGIIDIYERFRLMLDERLDEILRKINDLGNRISQLENRSQ